MRSRLAVRLPYHRAFGAMVPGGGLALRIGRLLTNDNAKNRHPHWSATHKDRKAWGRAVAAALEGTPGLTCDYGGLNRAPKRRMRLVIIREVPSRANFIRDRDNLVWATKRLRDALKGANLIYDDSMKWLEFPDPLQQVSGDGKPWTVVLLEPCEVTDVPERSRPVSLQRRQAAPRRPRRRQSAKADR